MHNARPKIPQDATAIQLELPFENTQSTPSFQATPPSPRPRKRRRPKAKAPAPTQLELFPTGARLDRAQ
jgi:hypothetical protein